LPNAVADVDSVTTYTENVFIVPQNFRSHGTVAAFDFEVEGNDLHFAFLSFSLFCIVE